MHRTTILFAAALVITMASTPAGADEPVDFDKLTERELKELQKNATPESLARDGDWWRDRKSWERTLRRSQTPMFRVLQNRGEDIAWDHDPPRRNRYPIVVLDPPLPKTTRADLVQVEHFYSLIDEDGTASATVPPRLLVWLWFSTWTKDTPAQFQRRMIGKGPTLLRRYNPHRLTVQEISYAFHDGAAHSAERRRGAVSNALHHDGTLGRIHHLDNREAAEEVIKRSGESVAHYRAQLGIGKYQLRERIDEANDRFRALMTQAIAANPEWSRTPNDPILLIEGKYALLGSRAGPKSLFRTANALIRQEAKYLALKQASGRPGVIDRDELRVADRALKLWGVQGPSQAWCQELDVPRCAIKAHNALYRLLDARRFKRMTCSWDPAAEPAAGAPLAQCTSEHDPWDCDEPKCDLNYQLVKSGWAVVVADHDETRAGNSLLEAERHARKRRKGLWRHHGRDTDIPAAMRQYR